MYDAMLAETVTIRGDGGDEIEAYLARPMSPGPYGGVVVIHHMPGYDEPTKEIARTFAVHGYNAIIPNLYHRDAPGASPDDAAAAVSLPLDAAVDCYGAFVVGSPPDGMPLKVGPIKHLIKDLSCPLLGLFGADDQYPSPEQVDELEQELKAQGKTYEFHSYEGAGHAFFSVNRPAYRPEAAMDGWQRIAVDGGQLVGGEVGVAGGGQVFLELAHAARADQGRGHPRVAQHPGQRHLGQRLAPGPGDLVQHADVRERGRRDLVGGQRAVNAGPRAGRHAVQVLAGQYALGQRRERDTAHALTAQHLQQPALDPSVQHRVRRLVDQQPDAHLTEQGDGLHGPFGRIRGNARVQGLARPDRGVQRTHRLLERGVRVEAVGVEDVHVLQAHPAQRLVQAGQQVLAGAPFAVRAGPHVVAGLGRDDQLVAVGPEVLPHDPAKINFG